MQKENPVRIFRYFREVADESKSLRNSWLSMQIWGELDSNVWSIVINSEHLHIFQHFYLRHISATASVEQQIANLQCPVKWLTDDIGRPGVPISLRPFVFRRLTKAFIKKIQNYKRDWILDKRVTRLTIKSAYGNQHWDQFWNCFKIFVFQVRKWSQVAILNFQKLISITLIKNKSSSR